MQLDLLILTFDGSHSASRALADVRATAGVGRGWLTEVAIVERHESGRVSMGGTYAGYYGEAHEGEDVVAGAAIGSLTGGLIGLIGGPAGFIVGLVGGGVIGGGIGKAVENDTGKEVYDRVKDVLPPDSSALLLLAATPTIDEMLAAFAAYKTSHKIEQLTDAEVAELEQAAA